MYHAGMNYMLIIFSMISKAFQHDILQPFPDFWDDKSIPLGAFCHEYFGDRKGSRPAKHALNWCQCSLWLDSSDQDFASANSSWALPGMMSECWESVVRMPSMTAT
jgi:hypothetical protein